MSSIPSTAAELPTPPANDRKVTFGGGGNHQTWKLDATIEDGVYPATVKSWKRITSSFMDKNNQPKEQFVFLCSVDGREQDGELAHYTGTSITGHPKEKLGPFLKAAKLQVPTPKNPDLPDPVGAKIKIFVSNEPSTKDPSKTYPKITKVLAA